MVRVTCRSSVSATSFKDVIHFPCLNADSGRYADALIIHSLVHYRQTCSLYRTFISLVHVLRQSIIEYTCTVDIRVYVFLTASKALVVRRALIHCQLTAVGIR